MSGEAPGEVTVVEASYIGEGIEELRLAFYDRHDAHAYMHELDEVAQKVKRFHWSMTTIAVDSEQGRTEATTWLAEEFGDVLNNNEEAS